MSNKRNNRGTKRVRNAHKSNRRGRGITTLGSVDLPHINQKPIQTRCIRYVGTTVTTRSTLAVADIRSAIGVVINATTNYVPIIDSFRIRRVGISALLSGTTGSGAVTFAWEGPNVPDISDTSFVGNAIPITRSYYPPPNTSCSWWYDNGATSVDLFSIIASPVDSGDVTIFLDIDLEYIIQDGTQTALALTANPGFTGVAYLRLPATQTTWVPLGLNAVTSV